nr:phage integrase N-terminal SAM-like domain-containing protein [Chitinophagaceae bacterium]
MQAIQASYIFHHNEQRIRLQFKNHGPLNKLIKSIPAARWSRTYKSRHIPCNTILYKSFKNNLPEGCQLTEIKKVIDQQLSATNQKQITTVQQKPTANTTVQKKVLKSPPVLNDVNKEALQNLIKILTLKFYSTSTVKTYCNEFTAFLHAIKNVPVDIITPHELQRYILYCINTLKLSENTVHSRMNALKFYFEQVLH